MRQFLRIAAPIFSVLLVGGYIYIQSSQVKARAAGNRMVMPASKSRQVIDPVQSSPPAFLLPGSKSDVVFTPAEAARVEAMTPPTMLLSGSKSLTPMPSTVLPASKNGIIILQAQLSPMLTAPASTTQPASDPARGGNQP